MSKKIIRRDFTAEAAAEVDQIVSAYPNRQSSELYAIAMKHCPAVRDWIDDKIGTARQTVFKGLLRFSKETLSDGRKVRTNASYKKWTQTDHGKEKQITLWKPVKSMTRDEAKDTLRDLDDHTKGCIESRNVVADYWNETHPKLAPLRQRFK